MPHDKPRSDNIPAWFRTAISFEPLIPKHGISVYISCRHGLGLGLGWSMEIRNGGAMWTDYVVNVYCYKLQGKWN